MDTWQLTIYDYNLDFANIEIINNYINVAFSGGMSSCEFCTLSHPNPMDSTHFGRLVCFPYLSRKRTALKTQHLPYPFTICPFTVVQWTYQDCLSMLS
jgi:hypothetical protein